MIDRERFTQARHSCLEPVRSVGKVPVGELSLSGRPECLSLQDAILTDAITIGKSRGQRYHPCPNPKQGRPADRYHASMHGLPQANVGERYTKPTEECKIDEKNLWSPPFVAVQLHRPNWLGESLSL